MATATTAESGVFCATDTAYAVPFATREMIEAPDSPPRPAQAHADFETMVQAVDGVVYVASDEHEWVLTPGDVARIPAGTPYRRWNAGEGEARWVEVYCRAA